MTTTSEVVIIVLALVAAGVFGYEAWRTRGLGWLGLVLFALAFLLHAVSVRLVP
jgi:hypothetical protein